ncbi:hypothetical protein, partial [Methylocella sp.]|uniref:hypothetical protein n=1 Tax=Methylocella sp. TaxID=1978226 RepID=UPI003C210D74
ALPAVFRSACGDPMCATAPIAKLARKRKDLFIASRRKSGCRTLNSRIRETEGRAGFRRHDQPPPSAQTLSRLRFDNTFVLPH